MAHQREQTGFINSQYSYHRYCETHVLLLRNLSYSKVNMVWHNFISKSSNFCNYINQIGRSMETAKGCLIVVGPVHNKYEFLVYIERIISQSAAFT